MRSSVHVPVTGAKTHHFFCVDPGLFLPCVTDSDGTILVFLDPKQAERAAVRRFGERCVVAVAGMGDEKWAEFQRSERFRVVPREESE